MRSTTLSLASVGLIALLLLAPSALAHKTTYSDDGRVKIVWGFLNEPAITMTKTGLDLILTDNATGAPLEGVHETLNASLVYGGEVHEFEDFRAQHGQKGRYTDVITLTRPGLYSLRLVGTINGTAVDVTIPGAHEIHAIEETYFPALPEGSAADVSALEAKIAQLEAKVAALEAKAATQARTPVTLIPQEGTPATQGEEKHAVPAPALGLVALALVAAVLVARRRA